VGSDDWAGGGGSSYLAVVASTLPGADPSLPLAATSDKRPPSAPRDTQQGRALLQTRLAQFGRAAVGIGSVFLALGISMAMFMELPGELEAVVAEAATLLVGVGVWQLSRARPLSERALQSIDALAIWTLSGAFIALGLVLPLYARPELVQLTCVSNVLVLRAVLVPSSAARTAWLSSAPLAAILASTYFLYRAGAPHPDAPPAGAYVALALIFCLGVLVIVTLTSRTIFGLRERVREAFQVGQYTLLEKLGEGGMGVVYKARHATLRRPTAIKLLPPERAGEHNLSRFEREVQLTSRLTHPNTIAIYDYGRSADGVLYYAMEYLDGVDLDTLIAIDGPQAPARVVHILTQVCGALAEAHAIGLIHRDIKPGNVLLCQRGGQPDVAKVVDFGLVKELGAQSGAGNSAVDQIIGTPLYMSPESIVSPGKVDARSDLYAVGALGYFLLTGQPVFSGASVVEVCGHHLHSTPPPPADRLGQPLPADLEAVILSCLNKDRNERPASARALAKALAACALPAWEHEQAAECWQRHAAAIAETRRVQRGDTRPLESSAPRGMLAIDLVARSREGTVPWHDVLEPPAEV
jgi:eukaryotic-like serine/threonine-protein kinase